MRTNFLRYPSEIRSPPNSQLTPSPSFGRSGAGGLRFMIRIQILVAPRQIRAATGGIADLTVGAAAGDTLPSINRRIREPLRVEFGGGELESGGSDRRVAAGGGSVVQCEDADRGDGGVRGGGKGSGERRWYRECEKSD
ncbi:hypothetical protein SASPL_106085 [Salvia splendens]|uniref:Uncharacterized protein n=1 Tax=Salvia splendens TaxID=180675 RepID=A0A8X8YM74_SALSN|nr:hypothetical protein SASPL_106085 [Salvia splendens]